MFRIIVMLTIAVIIWSAYGLVVSILGMIGLLLTTIIFAANGHTPWVNKKREADAIRRAQTGYQFWD